MEYTVLKNFKDKYTNKYYGMGFSYNSEDAERLAELERGGYIAAQDSEAAQMVQANSTNKDTEAMGQNEKAMDEAYSIIDGKRVSVKEAKAAAEASEQRAMKQDTQMNQTTDHAEAAAKAAQHAINAAEAKQAAQQAKAKAKTKNQMSE